jgi:CRISPR-associated endoribonuclease Cas6
MFINFKHNEEIVELSIDITLIGEKSISYFPYLFFSIVRAGEKGIFRNRIKFKVANIFANEEAILVEDDKLNMDFERKNFHINTDIRLIERKKLKIDFISPIRLRKNSKLIIDIDYIFLLKAIFRRIDLLCKIYNKKSVENYINFSDLSEIIYEKNIFEKEKYYYYSSRLKKKILLIGTKGFIEVEKKLSNLEKSLLKGAEIFGIGSNTSFGFGKVKIKYYD